MYQNEESDTVETVERECPAHIGHNMHSQTLYTHPITDKNYPWVFTDCPGFLDNRMTNDTIVTSISMELTIRIAKQVKGIVILMDATEFLSSRLTALGPLMKILIKLFRDPVEMLKYSVIGVTKLDQIKGGKTRAKKITLQGLNKIKEECRRRIKTLETEKRERDGTDLIISEYKVMEEFTSAVLGRKDDIMFIDILDDGDSKQLVTDRICAIRSRTEAQTDQLPHDTSPPPISTSTSNAQQDALPLPLITIADFNFEDYDINRTSFNKAIYDLAGEGNQLIGAITGVTDQLKRAIDLWNDNKKRMTSMKRLRSELDSYVSASEVPTKLINTWSEMLEENEQSIQSEKRKMQSVNDQLKKFKQELNEINTDKPVIFAEKKYIKKEQYWTYHEVLFDFDTEDERTPIVDIDQRIGSGRWCSTTDERRRGRYKTWYQSGWWKSGDATMTVYIASKHDTGNRRRIKDLRVEISRCKESFDELNDNVLELKKSKERISSNITSVKNVVQEEVEKDRTNKLRQCDGDIEQLSARMAENRRRMEKSKAKGLELLENFYGDSDTLKMPEKFEIVQSINELLRFPSTLVYKFIKRYKTFKANFDATRRYFQLDLNETDLSQLSQDNTADELDDGAINKKDPITGKWIRTLVVTKAGTGFELSSLMEQFPMNSVGSVFEFTHPTTGKKERILYGDWAQLNESASPTSTEEEQISQVDQVLSMSSNDPQELNRLKQSVEEEIEMLTKIIQEREEELFTKQRQLDKIIERLKRFTTDETTEDISSMEDSFVQLDITEVSSVPTGV
ncbi:uncharacterized protein TRIADDRAFT_57163 [Trichoplax adhaerens]|uniref:Uncharacterized protein n=1 Tax=Trichoplax adhaerens TaxID=10228 RepID=B3S0T5_TRIAD|nr:hypothetical protein TRIADDRAFT_57163 [Trichoplax adhaerens]EDV23700.1 hypothetical protein TRIADDRAFT_57163 [Trichoplax adhaerens]|eukprot:XP_002113226.1 hypothetical protein TRIADDRAFT_57163 [Trichoplax adhaerens]